MVASGMSLREARVELAGAMLAAALRKTKGNKVRAAKLLRLHRNTLDRNLEQHAMDFRVFKYPGLSISPQESGGSGGGLARGL